MTEAEQIYMEQLGSRIAEARSSKNQVLFAKDLGVNKNTLLGYEKGRVAPDILTILKICTLTGVTLEWLVNGENRCCLNDEQQSECPQDKRCMINHLEDPFITDIKLWLNEMTSDDPGWRVWFKMEILSKIPMFKEWWEKKRGGDAPKQSSAA